MIKSTSDVAQRHEPDLKCDLGWCLGVGKKNPGCCPCVSDTVARCGTCGGCHCVWVSADTGAGGGGGMPGCFLRFLAPTAPWVMF